MESGDDDDELWWRPAWETDDEVEPPGRPRSRQTAAEPDYTHPLLGPLAKGAGHLARLEARAEAAPPAITEGLRARLAYREGVIAKSSPNRTLRS